MFVAIAIEAFNKLGTVDEDQHQVRPMERQPSDPRPSTTDVSSFNFLIPLGISYKPFSSFGRLVGNDRVPERDFLGFVSGLDHVELRGSRLVRLWINVVFECGLDHDYVFGRERFCSTGLSLIYCKLKGLLQLWTTIEIYFSINCLDSSVTYCSIIFLFSQTTVKHQAVHMIHSVASSLFGSVRVSVCLENYQNNLP